MIRANNSITIEDVARAAGVSRAAVSKVIRDAYGVSDEMKAKVEAAIEFALGTGNDAVIGSLADLPALLAGTAGSRVSMRAEGVTYRGPVAGGGVVERPTES